MIYSATRRRHERAQILTSQLARVGRKGLSVYVRFSLYCRGSFLIHISKIKWGESIPSVARPRALYINKAVQHGDRCATVTNKLERRTNTTRIRCVSLPCPLCSPLASLHAEWLPDSGH